jgi:hypothetical protein
MLRRPGSAQEVFDEFRDVAVSEAAACRSGRRSNDRTSPLETGRRPSPAPGRGWSPPRDGSRSGASAGARAARRSVPEWCVAASPGPPPAGHQRAAGSRASRECFCRSPVIAAAQIVWRHLPVSRCPWVDERNSPHRSAEAPARPRREDRPASAHRLLVLESASDIAGPRA